MCAMHGTAYRQQQVYVFGVLNTVIQMIQQYDLNLEEILGGEEFLAPAAPDGGNDGAFAEFSL